MSETTNTIRSLVSATVEGAGALMKFASPAEPLRVASDEELQALAWSEVGTAFFDSYDAVKSLNGR